MLSDTQCPVFVEPLDIGSDYNVKEQTFGKSDYKRIENVKERHRYSRCYQ